MCCSKRNAMPCGEKEARRAKRSSIPRSALSFRVLPHSVTETGEVEQPSGSQRMNAKDLARAIWRRQRRC